MTSPRPSVLRCLRFGTYHRFVCSSLPMLRRPNPGPGLLLPRRPRRLFSSVETTETSQVPGQTPVRTRPALRPRRTRCSRPLQNNRYCLPLRKPRRLRMLFPLEALSRGSHAPCVRFAAEVALGPRNTRFRLVANLCRVGLSPTRSATGGFRSVDYSFLQIFPLPQALPGAIPAGTFFLPERKRRTLRCVETVPCGSTSA